MSQQETFSLTDRFPESKVPDHPIYVHYIDWQIKFWYNPNGQVTMANFIHCLVTGNALADTQTIQLFYSSKGKRILIRTDEKFAQLLKVNAIITIEDDDSLTALE